MSQIKEVIPREEYRLEVILDNGSNITINMENRLETLRFGMLKDKYFFSQAETDGCYIRWGNKIEISLSEVFQLARK